MEAGAAGGRTDVPTEGIALIRERDLVVLGANHAWADLFGHAVAEVIGCTMRFLRDARRSDELARHGAWEGLLDHILPGGRVTYWAQVCVFDDVANGRVQYWRTFRPGDHTEWAA